MTDQGVTPNTLYAYPVIINDRCLIDRMYVNVATGGASSTMRFGIYRDLNGKPGSLIVDAGTVATTTTTLAVVTVSSGILEPGTYWLAAARQGGSPPTVACWTAAAQQFLPSNANFPTLSIFADASVSGALPDPFGPVVLGATACPVIFFRIANTQVVQVNTAFETDEALSITPVLTPFTPGTVTQAVETDTALEITPRFEQVITVGQAVETDSARPITAGSPVRNLLTSGSNADTSSYTTTSYAPVGNKLLWAEVQSSPGGPSPTPEIPTMTGNGVTWVEEDTQLDATGTHRTTWFRGMVASPTEGAATIDFGGQTQFHAFWSISEIGGVDTGGTNGSAAVVQTAKATASSASTLSITLSAFASASNISFGSFGLPNFRTVTAGSGFTTIGSFGLSGVGTVFSEWKLNDTTVDVSLSAPATISGIAVEIKTA